jgi:hypothetical protein
MVATGPRLPKPIGGDSGGDEPLRISLGEGMMGAFERLLRGPLHAAAVEMTDARFGKPGFGRAAARQPAGEERAHVGSSLARYLRGAISAPTDFQQPFTAP